MSDIDAAVQRAVDAEGWHEDWSDVLARTKHQNGAGRRWRRRAVMATIAAVALGVPLAAVGDVGGWWGSDNHLAAPQPATTPVTVASGSWDGHGWELQAYESHSGALCVAFTATDSPDSGSNGLGCSAFVGLPDTGVKPEPTPLSITYLVSSGGDGMPGYLVGPVSSPAVSVRVRFVNGDEATVPAVAGPEPLNRISFYAMTLPSAIATLAAEPPTSNGGVLSWIAGIDGAGHVVSCLNPKTASGGDSDLADCQ